MEGQGDLREQGEENQLLGSVSQARKSKCSKFWADPFTWKCMEVGWNAVTCQRCSVCRRLNYASGSNRKCTKPQILFVWKLLVLNYGLEDPIAECPRYMMFGCVNVTCSAQFSQETSTTPRRGAHSRLPKPVAAEKGSMTCVLNSCSTHKCIYVQDQTHCKLEGQAYILWYSIICLRSPFTSETDVPWCSSHVIIHWRVIHTNLDFLNYSFDSAFLQAWCFRTWKRNLLVLRVFEIAWNLDTTVVWLSCPVDLDRIEQVLQECWFFAACIKMNTPKGGMVLCDSNMFIIWMTANFNSVSSPFETNMPHWSQI